MVESVACTLSGEDQRKTGITESLASSSHFDRFEVTKTVTRGGPENKGTLTPQ